MVGRSRQLRIGTQGRLVLPRELRDELGAEEGAVYTARVEDGALVLESPARVLQRLQRQAAEASPGDVSWVDELLADRRAEADRGDATR